MIPSESAALYASSGDSRLRVAAVVPVLLAGLAGCLIALLTASFAMMCQTNNGAVVFPAAASLFGLAVVVTLERARPRAADVVTGALAVSVVAAGALLFEPLRTPSYTWVDRWAFTSSTIGMFIVLAPLAIVVLAKILPSAVRSWRARIAMVCVVLLWILSNTWRVTLLDG